MKKNFLSIGLLCASAFVLTNCNNQIAEPQVPVKEGMPFELTATPQGTKTENDGMATKWVTDDALNVFHAEAGTTTTVYGTNDKFTYSASNTFSGTLTKALAADKSYDWYALYPYSKYVTTPAATSGGYIFIGHSSGAVQTGNDSKAHLSGTLCPLYGVSKNVSASDPVSISMNHLTSVVKIVVKNTVTDPLTVESIEFSTGKDIVGSYYINFTGSDVVYTGNSTNTVANLSVTGGTALAQGESASFYIPIKPHKAAAGSTISIKVNGYEKSKVLSSDLEFVAGKMKTMNFDFDSEQTVFMWNLAEDSTSEASAEKIGWTNSVAKMLCVKGESTNDANSYYPGDGNNPARTSTRFYAKSTLSITPLTSKNLTYYTFKATSSNYANAFVNSTWTNAYAIVSDASNYVVTVVAIDPAQAVSAVIGGACGFTKVECHTDAAPYFAPIIKPSKSSLAAVAAGETCSLDYTIDFPVLGKSISASSDQTWVNSFDCSTAGKISFTVDANTGAARTATITLSYEGADDVTVSVNQAKQITGDIKQETITLSSGIYSGSGASGAITWTGTSCSIKQTNDGGSTNVNSSYVSAPRWYQSNVISFTSNSGFTLTKVVVTCTTNAYATSLKDSTYSSGASAVVSGSEVTITTSGDFKIKMGAQVRVSSITVYYAQD